MKNQEAKKWHQEQFMPWKNAMEQHINEQQALQQLIQQNASELKYVISLLLDGRFNVAVQAWNNLGLEPKLSNVTINSQNGELVLTDENGANQAVNIDVLFGELEKLLKA